MDVSMFSGFLTNHGEAIYSSLGSLLIAFFLTLQPKINRFLDRLTSSPAVKDILWLISKLEDGNLTKEEADQILGRVKTTITGRLTKESAEMEETN